MKPNFNSIIKGSVFLGVGAFIAKLLGALYRIPLTNLIGGYGLGLYQMVFPIYTVLLDFSGAGAPSALSKLIAGVKEENDENTFMFLRASLRLLTLLGAISTVIMLLSARGLSRAQGDENAYYAYLALAPAIFFVCLISVFRGYFQGKMDMLPTALSQISEQVVKLGVGLTLCKILLPNIPLAVAGATFAITISEILCFIQLYITFKLKTKTIKSPLIKKKNENYFFGIKKLIKLIIPISLIGIILPLSQVFDSFITINLLKKNFNNATALYGLFSGVVLTVIHLPVSVCYGVSVSIIPAVSGTKSLEDKKKNVKNSLMLTFFISFLSAIVIGVFAPTILRILFSKLKEEEFLICLKLLKISSISIIFHALLQTINGVLIGEGKVYNALIGMMAGVLVKSILTVILLQNPQINIYGSAISSIACYFIAFLINFLLVIKKVYINEDKKSIAQWKINYQ